MAVLIRPQEDLFLDGGEIVLDKSGSRFKVMKAKERLKLRKPIRKHSA